MDRYEEALAKARAGKSLEEIFPELRKSEDERILKGIIGKIDHDQSYGVSKSEMLAYLERQKAKKPVESTCQSFRDALFDCLDETVVTYIDDYTPDSRASLIEGQTERWAERLYAIAIKQKPAEWSEEDEAMRDNILRLLNCFVGTSECDSNPSLSTSYPVYQREMDWLKSLRPQPHWKPSEEQMEAIESLQQEQTELPGINESGIPGKDYIPVEWVDACEMYGKWKIVKQEQPEVDLEKELDAFFGDGQWKSGFCVGKTGFLKIASHFYDLGRQARKI